VPGALAGMDRALYARANVSCLARDKEVAVAVRVCRELAVRDGLWPEQGGQPSWCKDQLFEGVTRCDGQCYRFGTQE